MGDRKNSFGARRSNAFRGPTLLALILSTTSACDIPTQGPDFSFRTAVSTPVVFEQTFTFLGPDSSNSFALIDTTKASFDSLFRVDEGTNSVFLVQDVDGFDFEGLDQLIDPVSVDPQDVSMTLGDFATQTLDASHLEQIGIVEQAPATTPALPPAISNQQAFFPLSTTDLLRIPPTQFVDLSGSDVEEVRLTTEPAANNITFAVTNNLTEPLTDGSGSIGSAPIVLLETSAGTELARQSFDRAPGPGQTAVAVLDLSSITIPAGSRFRFDMSTPSGFGPIASDPASVPIQADVTTVRYDGFTLSNIPASAVDSSPQGLPIAAEVQFRGLTTRSGAATLTIYSSMPIPVRIDRLEIINDQAVDQYPAGHVAVDQAVGVVDASGTLSVPVQIGQTALSSTVSLRITATSSYTSDPSAFTATDGLSFGLGGDVDIDKLYYYPNGETFNEDGQIDLDVDEIRLSTSADYVELASGALEFVNLLNGLDLTFENAIVSFPDLRTPPYSPADSLVVRFVGTTDKVGQYQFSRIARNAPPRSVSIDLAGMRLYGPRNEIRYHIRAVSESSSAERVLVHSDEVSASARGTNLEVAAVYAFIEPFSAELTSDANGDRRIDPLVPAEAKVSQLDDFGLLEDLNGLELEGVELAVSLTTSFSADLTLYGVLIGEDADGNQTFLEGRSELAVSPTDSVLASFEIGGMPARADQVFRLFIQANGTPDQPSTQSAILRDQNSNVSAFISAMPRTLRFVGKAVVETPGGRVEIRQPADVDLSLGTTIPLNVTGEFTFEQTLSADLSALEGITDPEATFTAESAGLYVEFFNGIPLGVDARFEFLDDLGDTTLIVPEPSTPSIAIEPATTGPDGFAASAGIGSVEIDLSEDKLRSLARSRDVRLLMTFRGSNANTSRIRASDEITVRMHGNFDVNVTVGN